MAAAAKSKHIAAGFLNKVTRLADKGDQLGLIRHSIPLVQDMLFSQVERCELTVRADPRLISLFRGMSRASSAIVVLLGCLVLVGWVFNVDTLKRVFPGLVSMKVNTAISFITAGLALWLLQPERDGMVALRVGQMCAIVSAGLGLLNIAEYMLGLDLGIDQLLFRDVEAGVVPPGRMAGAAALTFVMIGPALLLLPSENHRDHFLAQLISLLASVSPLLSIIGYFYSVQSLYLIGQFGGTALHTALGLAVLCAGVFFARPESGLMAVVTSDSPAGLMARRLAPAVVVVPPILGWFVLLGYRAGYYDATLALALLVLSSIIVFALLISLSSWSLLLLDLKRGQAERERERLLREVEQLAVAAQRRAAELDVSNKELQGFAYSVAHDLRAPARQVNNFSQVLLKEYADRLDGRGRGYLQFLGNAAQKMGQLIDDLLKLSRVTRAEMVWEPVNLSEIAQSVAAGLRKRQPERQVEVTIAPGMVAIGDPQLLRTVLENLLDNAWKFTSTRPVARAEFGVTWEDTKPVYYVGDNGVGFDMSYVDKLFGAFQRLHRADEFPGTGIGLAIVQRIIQRHGGRVWAEGEVDKGATIYLTLG